MTDYAGERITAEAFLSLEERNTPVELIGGEVIVSPSPADDHQRRVLSAALYLRQHASTGETRVAPLDVLLDEENVVQPDVFWISTENTACVLVAGRYWQGAPDLAIEVVSPSSARRDYRDKYDLYQRHGVREYWIVEPVAPYLTVHTRDEKTGSYVEQGSYRPGDHFTSAALGLSIDITALLG